MNSFSEYIIIHLLFECSLSDLFKNLIYDGHMSFLILKTLKLEKSPSLPILNHYRTLHSATRISLKYLFLAVNDPPVQQTLDLTSSKIAILSFVFYCSIYPPQNINTALYPALEIFTHGKNPTTSYGIIVNVNVALGYTETAF